MQKVVNEFFNSGIPLGHRTTKSDIFPSKRNSFSSLLPPRSNFASAGAISQIAHTNVPTVAHHKLTSIPNVSKAKASEELLVYLHYNIPHHNYDLETRDNAVAQILLNRQVRIESALKSAGFSDCEASDVFLQRNIIDLVSEICNHGQRLKSCDIRVNLAARRLSTKTTSIRKAMEIVGFLSHEIDCAQSRLHVLIDFFFNYAVSSESSTFITC